MKRQLTSLALIVGMSVPSFAKTPLHENEQILESFYQLGLADEIRKNCATIAPRLFRALGFVNELERFAHESGYTDAEIEALLDNDEAKDALRAQISVDLAARGASPETPEGYCAVGQEEIAKGSAAGKLLRNR